jgi:integrative and conjugative element protein (TIGR02256 family)
MILNLPQEVVEAIVTSLRKAGRYEIGGILLAEHTGVNEFTVHEITIHRRGRSAYFIRRIEDALGKVRSFFQKTDHNYSKFNYLGEWHSHPSFEPYPSTTDDKSMLEIVQDDTVGANFAVLLIVKLSQDDKLSATAHTYFPSGLRRTANVKVID